MKQISDIKPLHPGLNEVLLTIYLTFISISSVYLYVTRQKFALVLIIAGMLAVYYFISSAIIRILKKISIRPSSGADTRKLICIFAVTFIVSMAVLLICFMAAFPGSLETDCLTQFKQTLSGEYDDWHPVWHTLVYYSFPYKLTGRVYSITLFQLIYFALALAYMTVIIYKHAGAVWSIISYLYIVLNPFTLFSVVSPLKDVGFSTVCLAALTIAADIFFDKNDKKVSPVKCILLGFIITNAAIFRQNGLLFSFFLIFALFFHMSRSGWLITTCVCILSYIIIQGPVNTLVGTARSDTAVIQVVGLPMSIIGNVAKDTPELMDEETEEFIYGIAPREVWEERYNRGDFNLMKYGGLHDPDVIEEKGVWPIVKMAARCTIASPQASLEAFFALTDFVYGFDIRNKQYIDVCVLGGDENDLGIEYTGNRTLAEGMFTYYELSTAKGFNFAFKLGFTLLIVIAAILASCRLNVFEDWKRIFLAFPILAYDFGTMLLLSGHDARFFLVSFWICPLTVLIMLGKTAANGEQRSL